MVTARPDEQLAPKEKWNPPWIAILSFLFVAEC
jgi:hypothetical protein